VSALLVPVTVARWLPATLPLHERADAPEPPLILVALRAHERLVELVITARVTVPPKPFTFRGATVIVEVPATFTFTLTLVGLAVVVKSWKLKLIPDERV
jgi:hypothetical protein